jgi:hypothetical protein
VAIDLATNHAKNVLIYYYKDTDPVSIKFRALSKYSYLKDDFVFLTLKNPTEKLVNDFGIKSFPSIGGVIAALDGD